MGKKSVPKRGFQTANENMNLESNINNATSPAQESHDRPPCDCESISMLEAAKLLGMGRTKFMERLREEGLLLNGNLPSDKMIEAGYMVYELTEHKRNRRLVCRRTTRIEVKALAYIIKKVCK